MKKLGKRRKIVPCVAQHEKERSCQIELRSRIGIVGQKIVQKASTLLDNSTIVAKEALAQDRESSGAHIVVDFHIAITGLVHKESQQNPSFWVGQQATLRL